MKERDRLELLDSPGVRELLAFELEAHRRILAEAKPEKRRALYREIYARWPSMIGALPAARGLPVQAFGFTPEFLEWFRPWLSGRRVLEVGCGNGSASAALVKLAAQATGMDVSDDLVVAARRAVPEATFVVGDVASDLPFEDASFDAVYWNDVAEHLHPDDLTTALSQLRRVLRPGGHLCTITCHRDDGPHDASMLILPQGAASRGVHIQEFTYGEWRTLCLAAGFRNALSPVLGINLLSKLHLLERIESLMASRGVSYFFESRWPSHRFRVLRWATGCNVVCSVAEA